MPDFTAFGIGWFVVTAMVGAVMWAAQIHPDQAVSNLSVWAERLGFSTSPALRSPSVDRVVLEWAKIALAILLLVGIAGAMVAASKSIPAIGLTVCAAGLVIFGAWYISTKEPVGVVTAPPVEDANASPLQKQISSFLARSGRRGAPGAFERPENYVMTDQSDGRGPYIEHWGAALGPPPTLADGFTDYQLHRLLRPALKRSYGNTNSKQRLEDDLVEISRSLNGPGMEAYTKATKIAANISPHPVSGPTWERYEPIKPVIVDILTRLDQIHSLIWDKLIKEHREQAEDLSDAVKSDQDLVAFKQSANRIVYQLDRFKIIFDSTNAEGRSNAADMFGDFRAPFEKDAQGFNKWITDTTQRINAKIQALNQ